MWLNGIPIMRIMTVLFCFMCGINNIDSQRCCKEMKINGSLILTDDGYTGVIQYVKYNNNPENSQDCGNICTNHSQPDWACIISLDTNKTEGHFCSDYGIEIQKPHQSDHICLKNHLYSNGPVLCFLPGNCSSNWPGQTGICQGAIELDYSKTSFNFTEILCNNRTEEEKIILIKIERQNENQGNMCLPANKTHVTDTNRVKEPKMKKIQLNDTTIVSENGEVDAAAAAKAMKSLPSVLSKLGNESSACITIGPVTGVLIKQQKNAESEFEEIYFALTSNSTVQDLEDPTPLEHASPGLVTVPKEAFEKASFLSSNDPFVAIFRFPNITKDANNSRLMNSEAIAIEMGAEIKNLTDMIEMTFIKVQDDAKVSCSSWNGEGNRPVWTTDGCYTFESNDTITCQCTHLTFFAMLMVSPEMTISSSDLKSLTYITYIGCGMSMFFLGIALFTHFLLRRAKANYATRILMNLFLAMFLLNLSFLSNEGVAKLENPVGCKIMAAAMHYSMLSTFTWFAVKAFHLCFQLVMSFQITVKHYILKVCIAGWALPGVVICILFCLGKYGSLTMNSKTSVNFCWITDNTVHYVVNIGYYAIVFLFTFTVCIIIVTRLMPLSRVGTEASKRGTMLKNMFAILGLCCMLGITWGFAFLSHGPLRIPSYYIFTILNSFQGFYLFLYYYNTSKIVGEEQASSSSTQSTSTIKTSVDTLNPYVNYPPKHKSGDVPM